ncbi:GAF domain-containing protein [Modestobacter roseus]|uniref:GAF domain-containing protein n=1 Tax=Modestobacter roseus TaxID=1181884 RepID=UPI0034E02EEE
MTADVPSSALRVADVLASVVSRDDRATWPMALVEECRRALGADGAGLAVADPDGSIAVLAATPGLGQAGEDLQFTLGEGPCQVASASGRPVLSPDLGADPRWSQYSREAGAHGIRAAFSAPLQVGAVRLGVLDVYRRVPGSLTMAALTSLQVYAEAAVAVLLLMADAGDAAAVPADVMEFADIRPVVHQAAGMVAVQLDVSLQVALVRLRGEAFAAGRSLRAVAGDVVARRLAFDHTDRGSSWRAGGESGDGAGECPNGHIDRVDDGDDPRRGSPDEHA